jgi:hypothetical protein
MNIYRIVIVSGNEYTVTIAANNPQEARAFALDLDIEELQETGDAASIVSECEEIQNAQPARIAKEQ